VLSVDEVARFTSHHLIPARILMVALAPNLLGFAPVTTHSERVGCFAHATRNDFRACECYRSGHPLGCGGPSRYADRAADPVLHREEIQKLRQQLSAVRKL
jgi:hypothetical protein